MPATKNIDVYEEIIMTNTIVEYRFRIVSARGNTTTPWVCRRITREELDKWIEDFAGATVTAERRELTPGPAEAYEPGQ